MSVDDFISATKVDVMGNPFKTPDGDLSLTTSDIAGIRGEFGVHVAGSYSAPLFVFRDLFGDEDNKGRLWDCISVDQQHFKGYLIHGPNNKLRVLTKTGARICAHVSTDIEVHLIIDSIIDKLYQLRYQRLKSMTRESLIRSSTENIKLSSQLKAAEEIIREGIGCDNKSVETYENERHQLLDIIADKDKIIDTKTRIIDRLQCEELSPFVLKLDCKSFQVCDVMTWVLNTWYYHRAIDHHADRLYPYSIAKPSDRPYKLRDNVVMSLETLPPTGPKWCEYIPPPSDPTKMYLSREHILAVRRRVTEFIDRYGSEAEKYVPPTLNQFRLDIDTIEKQEAPGTVPLRHKLSRVNMWGYDNDFEVMTGLVRPVFSILDPVYCEPCDGTDCRPPVELNRATGAGDTAKIKIMRISSMIVSELYKSSESTTNADIEWMKSPAVMIPKPTK